jgi:hypothetical protein
MLFRYVFFTMAVWWFVTTFEANAETSPMDYARTYYAEWIGVSAPVMAKRFRDQLTGADVAIDNYKGRRLLLYSFDSGDFANTPKEEMLFHQLRLLNAISFSSNTANIAVIGFTYGSFIFPRTHPIQFTNICDSMQFPLVNLTNVATGLPQPYRILSMPSGIFIDKNGVIVDIFWGPMNEQSLHMMVKMDDWRENPRPVPLVPPPDMSRIVPREMPAWTLYVFRRPLAATSVFKREYARRGTVYDKTLIPSDSVGKLDEIEGSVLKESVREGDPIRKSQFWTPK